MSSADDNPGEQLYLVGIGSNMRHGQMGSPRKVVMAALSALGEGDLTLVASSRIIETPPMGPSRRRYANTVAIVSAPLEPHPMLHRLQSIEQKFGRIRRGKAWGARVLDLDIVAWSGGAYAGHDGVADLVIPHPAFRTRPFVLAPAASIAGEWRDPLTGLRISHLHARLTKPRQAPR